MSKGRGLAKRGKQWLSSKADKAGGLGKMGHQALEIFGHAGLALADANLDTLGPIPVRPSFGAGIVAAGMAFLGKGKTKKLGMTGLKAVAHATITHWVKEGGITLVSGPDGTRLQQGPAKPKPTPVTNVNIGNDAVRAAAGKVAGADDDDDDDDDVTDDEILDVGDDGRVKGKTQSRKAA